MKRRHAIALGLCLIALTAGALCRLGEVPAAPIPAPVEQKAEPDTTGVYRLLARFNPGQAEALTVEVYKTAGRFDLIPEILAGLICRESSANPKAKNGNCLGLGQVSWKTWGKTMKGLGIAMKPADLHDPHRGLVASAWVLNHYMAREQDIRKALYRYRGKAIKAYADRVLAYASEAGL
jgi:hypothetical protein